MGFIFFFSFFFLNYGIKWIDGQAEVIVVVVGGGRWLVFIFYLYHTFMEKFVVIFLAYSCCLLCI